MKNEERKPHYHVVAALVECKGNVSVESVTLQSEMKDVAWRGSFECSDTLLNRIWQVGAYTLHLTDREVMIEGIKRDRWIWSGDAIQSYLMNYYAFFDTPVVKRTIWALRGKDPVQQHINTILDYTSSGSTPSMIIISIRATRISCVRFILGWFL